MKLLELEVPEINLVLPLDIQYFAEGDEDPVDDPKDPKAEPDKDKGKEDKGKTYTEEEFQAALKDRLAREKRNAEKAIKEAEKLAKMNEEERKQHEFEKLQKELEELRTEKERASLAKEASKMLSEHDIVTDDELLSFVVKNTAEDTQTAVNAFVTLFKAHVDKGVKAALAGKPPKTSTGSNKAITKEEIMAEKDTVKRQRLIAENPHLFKQFK